MAEAKCDNLWWLMKVLVREAVSPSYWEAFCTVPFAPRAHVTLRQLSGYVSASLVRAWSHRKHSKCSTGQKLETPFYKGKNSLFNQDLAHYTWFLITKSKGTFPGHARKILNLNSQVYQLSSFIFWNKIGTIWIEPTMGITLNLHLSAL